MTTTDALAALPTPSLILDEGRMARNVVRLRRRLDALGVALRPHLKVVKYRGQVIGDAGWMALSRDGGPGG